MKLYAEKRTFVQVRTCQGFIVYEKGSMLRRTNEQDEVQYTVSLQLKI